MHGPRCSFWCGDPRVAIDRNVTKLLNLADRTGLMPGQGNPMAEDKAELLRSLTIDRSGAAAPRVPSRRRTGLVALGVGAAILLVGAVMVPQFRGDPLVEHAASQPSAGVPAPSSSPTAEPRRAGILAASGYVVARRKATVAAEITGKVVAVMIEEGMIVKEGQEPQFPNKTRSTLTRDRFCGPEHLGTSHLRVVYHLAAFGGTHGESGHDRVQSARVGLA